MELVLEIYQARHCRHFEIGKENSGFLLETHFCHLFYPEHSGPVPMFLNMGFNFYGSNTIESKLVPGVVLPVVMVNILQIDLQYDMTYNGTSLSNV